LPASTVPKVLYLKLTKLIKEPSKIPKWLLVGDYEEGINLGKKGCVLGRKEIRILEKLERKNKN